MSWDLQMGFNSVAKGLRNVYFFSSTTNNISFLFNNHYNKI